METWSADAFEMTCRKMFLVSLGTNYFVTICTNYRNTCSRIAIPTITKYVRHVLLVSGSAMKWFRSKLSLDKARCMACSTTRVWRPVSGSSWPTLLLLLVLLPAKSLGTISIALDRSMSVWDGLSCGKIEIRLERTYRFVTTCRCIIYGNPLGFLPI